MGRPRKFNSVKALESAWEEYKAYCDNKLVLTHEFSQKSSQFISAELRKKVTYTIEGFCVFMGISRSTFYSIYGEDEKFSDTVIRMKEECEVDARQKFETGQIPTQLAGLWMSNYGYSTKQDNSISGAVPVVISGEEDLED